MLVMRQKWSGYNAMNTPRVLMVEGAVIGLSFMTRHKEHMTGSEILKLQTQVATLAPIATLVHRVSRLGKFPWILTPWRLLQALSSPRVVRTRTDDKPTTSCQK